MKVQIQDMSFYYSNYYNPIFEHINLNLDTDWSLGLIGRNGRGKSTFLKLLMGQLIPVSGKITMQEAMEYFPYEINRKYRKTIDVIKENVGSLKTMENQMDEIIQTKDESRYDLYSEIQEKYMQLGGYEVEAKVQKELSDMHLEESLLERDFDTLSGGERTRMQILVLFMRKSSFVLLDEPTNHLDLEGKEMLAGYLKKKKGYIVVSHDRDFLDQVTDHIMSINKSDIKIEQGNYSTWRRNMDQIEAYEFRTRDKLEREVNQLERRVTQNRTWANHANTQKYAFASHARTNGSRAYMRQAKKSEEQMIENRDAKMMLLRNYEEAKELQIIQNQSQNDTYLIHVKKLHFAYPNSRLLIKALDIKIKQGDRIWVKGRNGSGKSTFLKLLTKEIKTDQDITYAENLKIAVSSQEILWNSGFIKERFKPKEAIERKEREEQFERFLSFCDMFDMPDAFMDRPIETLSSGERKKIDIARALSEENDILFFDEPLNYMDVYFREQLEKALLEYEPTIVFVEHDSRFGRNVSNRVIEL